MSLHSNSQVGDSIELNSQSYDDNSNYEGTHDEVGETTEKEFTQKGCSPIISKENKSNNQRR